ncbi:MAG: GNAT family N-acetyltransferase [Alphaproteobacteria bacterium]|nr:GNAT family N-acetyltransferase [Alphaproteobacteria bacterium]
MAPADRREVAIERVTGEGLRRHIPDLARLRIQVFRDWPYLYEGDEAYEREYLETYIRSQRAVVVLALDGGRAVGASTALPLADEAAYVTRPFAERGLDIERFFYFGESVLDPTYRGRGIGVRFFEEREAHARSFNRFETACFCAVQRPDSHPMKPKDYVPLDAFWNRRGYAKDPGFLTTFPWRDIGEAEETEKPMAFWFKKL